MSKLILAIVITFSTIPLLAQPALKAIIKDRETREPLVGATAIVQGTVTGSMSDSNGSVEITGLSTGTHIIEFSYAGYVTHIDTLKFPNAFEVLEIFLQPSSEGMEEVVITATRSSRIIADLPTRVEAISGEELEEKGNMKPGDIRMMLNESTGIQTQQTSATSYNSSIRIQGLDGKYTQILRDGMPQYAGFSGGLSLLQIAPLDLRQVEVVKGASSTLYGGGAIAGLVNLVSKVPSEEGELSFMLNGTSALGLDASAFYGKKFSKLGTTVFASYNLGSPYDPADIGLTAIPKFRRYTVNPKIFFYLNKRTTMSAGVNVTNEERLGGDMTYVKSGGSNLYFEENRTNRFSTQLQLDHSFDERSHLTLKNSISYYDRSIEIPDYAFSGTQVSTFSELAYNRKNTVSEWVGGLNLWTDNFNQEHTSPGESLDYDFVTLGAFIQNTWNASEKFVLESGLRGDYQNEYGFFALPRISAMFRFNSKFTTRLGGGLGYKSPTAFTEDAEKIQFRNVLPINTTLTDAEKSVGGNLDVNYKTALSEDWTFSVNALLFYTQIKDPLVLANLGNGFYEYQQPSGYIDTKGIETNVKLTFKAFKLFIGYTLADVNQHYNESTTAFPLVAKHRLNNVLMYEIEEKLKIGLEAYYFSPQKLNDGAIGKQYWICGLMAEKMWEHFSLFINFENFLDTRQTRFDTIYTGSITSPVFRDIYAPVDGFVVNGGFKLRM